MQVWRIERKHRYCGPTISLVAAVNGVDAVNVTEGEPGQSQVVAMGPVLGMTYETDTNKPVVIEVFGPIDEHARRSVLHL